MAEATTEPLLDNQVRLFSQCLSISLPRNFKLFLIYKSFSFEVEGNFFFQDTNVDSPKIPKSPLKVWKFIGVIKSV